MSMAERRDHRSAEAAAYVSMAGRRVAARSAEAAVYAEHGRRKQSFRECRAAVCEQEYTEEFHEGVRLYSFNLDPI
jgi:hypothetical protein